MSITLYLVAWPGNLRDPIAASADAGSTGNVLHLIGAVAASFFLPLGYLGMSLLGSAGPSRPPLAMLREDERLGQAPAVV